MRFLRFHWRSCLPWWLSVRPRPWPRGAGEAKAEVIRAAGSRAASNMGPSELGPMTRPARS